MLRGPFQIRGQIRTILYSHYFYISVQLYSQSLCVNCSIPSPFSTWYFYLALVHSSTLTSNWVQRCLLLFPQYSHSTCRGITSLIALFLKIVNESVFPTWPQVEIKSNLVFPVPSTMPHTYSIQYISLEWMRVSRIEA